MSGRKQRLFIFIAITSGMLIALCLSIISGEVYYYLTHDAWYFSEKHARTFVGGTQELYREPFVIKKNTRVRIAAIGGSTTYGFGVNNELAWPKLLSQKLEKHFPGKYEVINLGRLGGHLEEFIQNFNSSSNVYIPREDWIKGIRPNVGDFASWGWKDLKPDIILLVPIVNDTAPDYLYYARPNVTAKIAMKGLNIISSISLANRFALSFYIKKGLIALENLNKEHITDNAERLAVIKNGYERNLEQFIYLWSKDVTVVLLGLPLLFNKEDRGKEAAQAARFWNLSDNKSLLNEVQYLPSLEGLEKEVRFNVSRRYNLKYVEIGSKVKKLPFNERLRFYVDSIHMNKFGTQLIADEVFKLF